MRSSQSVTIFLPDFKSEPLKRILWLLYDGQFVASSSNELQISLFKELLLGICFETSAVARDNIKYEQLFWCGSLLRFSDYGANRRKSGKPVENPASSRKEGNTE